jgi:hypothetical protein
MTSPATSAVPTSSSDRGGFASAFGPGLFNCVCGHVLYASALNMTKRLDS